MLDFLQTLTDIKSRGHWHVHIYPNNSINPQQFSLSSLKKSIRSTSVQLRGWDYPHVPIHNDEKQAVYSNGESIESWINWDQYKEIWRFHNTAQFVHLFGLREDWYENNSRLSADHYLRKIVPGTALDALGANYSITEIYIFIKNLLESGFFSDGVIIEISLRNTLNRELQVFDPRRASLFKPYVSMLDEIAMPSRTYLKDDFVEKYLDFALDQALYLFSQFNWDSPPISVLKEDQVKLLERRL